MSDIIARPHAVCEFQIMHARIYGEVNKRYGDLELVLRLLEEIAKIMEFARKDDRRDNFRGLTAQLARTYSWWNAVGTRYGIDLQEALWTKYPGICPYCLRSENCICGVEHPIIPDKEQKLRMFRRDRDREPKTLEAQQDLHRVLYGRQNDRILLIQTAAHIMEEAGEVGKEARHRNIPEMCDEMADVASWLFAVSNRCGVDLADAVWRQYPYECEKCHNTACNCPCSDPPEEE